MLLRKSALALSLAAGVVGGVSTALLAQEQPIVEVPNAKFSFIGQVNGSAVNIRSGPADSYYPTMKLNKGDKVVVYGYKFDWLKIAPPEGSFSYVAKQFVDKQGDALRFLPVWPQSDLSACAPTCPAPNLEVHANLVTVREVAQ